jgi:hypothetical protein
MAVFQAARARPATAPRRDARITSLGSRGRTRAFVRPRLIVEATAAVPRIRPAAILVVGVLLAASLGFAYLTQTLTSTATSVSIEQLRSEQERLHRIVQTRRALAQSDASTPLVIERAISLDLVELDKPIVPSAR